MGRRRAVPCPAWTVRSGHSWGLWSADITGAVTIWAESIRADKAATLDSAKRQDDRQLGRDHFQRETLLLVQEVLADFMRAEGRAQVADVTSIRATGDLSQYPEGISEEYSKRIVA